MSFENADIDLGRLIERLVCSTALDVVTPDEKDSLTKRSDREAC